MLRPATPLTILLLVAFVLLLISVLSTPIIRSIPLATFDGVDFGVFGFCKDGECSNIEIGYSFASIYSDSQDSTFDLPAATRRTLSAILIIHPIAAFFTLIMMILAASAHFHSTSHSPRYLLGIFILSILTLLLALLSFLIDVLLFVPHMAWGSYIVLAATILIAASGIVSCAMRRTLVSRKARKRRIAENAEMNGENFYNRQGADPGMPPINDALVSGGLGADKMPAFATFEMVKREEERSSDERIPLTTRTPSNTSHGNVPPGTAESDRYGGPPQAMGAGPGRDQFGNPMPPPGAFGSRSRDPSTDPSLNRQYSDTSMQRGRGGMPPGGFRGRGFMNGRGNYGPPRGYFNGPRGGRGGYPGPQGPYRGSPGGGSMMMRGGRGRGGPPGYVQDRSYGSDQSPAYDGYGRRPSQPDAYGRDISPPPAADQYIPYNPDESGSSFPRAESPPPLPGLDHEVVGQAVEMDATTGSPSMSPRGFSHFNHSQLRDSDADVAGMVGLQQQGMTRHTVTSETSRYSSDEYVPPRHAWVDEGRSSPLNPATAPAELHSSPGRRRVNSGDNYFEDVEPKFAETAPATHVPGPSATGYPAHSNGNFGYGGLDGNHSSEDIQEGARSPAGDSDRSNFTSVSQRGVNPRWQNDGRYNPPPMRRPVNAPPRNELLLNSNPDFQLPGRGRGGFQGRGGRGATMGGMVPGSSYPDAGVL